MPVRRAASSVEIWSDGEADVTRRRSGKAIFSSSRPATAEDFRHGVRQAEPCVLLRRSFGRSLVLQTLRAFDFAIEEVTQERPDSRNRGEMTDFIPGWRERCPNQIGGQLKGQRRHQPPREVEP